MNEKSLIQDYLDGMKVKEICKKYHCSTNTLSKVIDANNIQRRAKRKVIKKDLSKFYSIDSPETQYWLGYICADGNIEYNLDKKMYKVSLFSKDEEVIEAFISYFGNDIVNRHVRKQNGIIEAYICSKELCEYLVHKLNIVPNKSLILDPNLEYTSHFIRGYFDGDGCIRKSYDVVRYEAKFTSGSKKFLQNIEYCLKKEGIQCSIIKRSDCNAFDLHIYNKDNIYLLYRFLYEKASTYLKRKHEIFVALCEKSTDENRVNCENGVDNSQPSTPLTKCEGSTTNT